MFKTTFFADDINEFNVFLNEKNEEMKEGRKREDEMKRMKQGLWLERDSLYSLFK